MYTIVFFIIIIVIEKNNGLSYSFFGTMYLVVMVSLGQREVLVQPFVIKLIITLLFSLEK